jgi:hypothetical protein
MTRRIGTWATCLAVALCAGCGSRRTKPQSPVTAKDLSDRWGEGWGRLKLGSDGDGRGLRLTVKLDRQEYVPGEPVKYTVTFTNRGRRAIELDKPVRCDQFGRLVLFLHDGARWVERNPMGLGPDTNASVVLKPGQDHTVSGTLQHRLTPFGHWDCDPGDTSLKAVKCELRVRYKDKFSPKDEVACSNTVNFTVKPRGMTKLGPARVSRDQYLPYTLMRADDTGALFYCVKKLGTIRLGVLKDKTRFSVRVDKQSDVHVLWKSGAKQHTRVIFKRGLPDSRAKRSVHGEKARLERTENGEVRVLRQ